MSNLPADNIYQRLTDLRNQIGKSQKEVANDLDMPASVLSRIELGKTAALDLHKELRPLYSCSERTLESFLRFMPNHSPDNLA